MKSCGLSNNSTVTKNIFYYFTISLQEYTKSNTLHRKAKQNKWENFANKLLKSPDLIELYYSAFVVLYYSQDKLDLFW